MEGKDLFASGWVDLDLQNKGLISNFLHKDAILSTSSYFLYSCSYCSM